MAQISIQKLNKHYGQQHHAVRDLNLTIADKEFVALVGPSGCGKSTTLRMIAGLEDVTAGEISIGGRVVNDLPPGDRDIAMVFQSYALYQHMTVYDNLAFGLRNRKVPESTIRTEIDRAAGILGLNELMQRRPKQLSGGQQQRVALGRCIVRNPKVFLFDEPLSNLDAKLRTQMRLEIKRLRDRVPTTSVFVTHDQVEAMTLGDRVVIMKEGRIQQAGTPLEVYGKPATKFVAGFIGAPSMNFLEVAIRDEAGTLYAVAPHVRIQLAPEHQQPLERWRDQTVILGIRPEHLFLGEGAPNSSFRVRIEVCEQLGSEIILETRLGDTPITVARVDPSLTFEKNAVATLSLDRSQAHFFDPKSERSILHGNAG